MRLIFPVLVSGGAGGAIFDTRGGNGPLLPRSNDIVTFLTCEWGGVLTSNRVYEIAFKHVQTSIRFFEGRFSINENSKTNDAVKKKKIKLFAHPCSRPSTCFLITFFACHCLLKKFYFCFVFYIIMIFNQSAIFAKFLNN